MAKHLTPMLEQYHRIKSEHRDAILMVRMGDFYEMFFEDALDASQILEIALTSRGKGTDNEAPMCGVPYHAVDSHIARLIAAGRRVAICDQTEDPAKSTGLVRREVVRVVSPGTLTDPRALEAQDNLYIGCLFVTSRGIGGAFIDLSTGDFQVTESRADHPWEEIRLHVAALGPKEILHPEGHDPAGSLGAQVSAGVTFRGLPSWSFSYESALRGLTQQLGTRSLAGFGCQEMDLAIRAGGALLHNLRESQRCGLAHIKRLRVRRSADHMLLDPPTLRTLEVVESMTTGGRDGSLLSVIDNTVTAMGARLLKSWLLAPLLHIDAISDRHDAVAELVSRDRVRPELLASLKGILDMERILGRVTLGSANARDLVSLRESLARLPAVAAIVSRLEAPVLSGRTGPLASADTASPPGTFDTLSDLHGLLARAIADDPAATLHEGGLIRAGYDPDLDEIRSIAEDGTSYIAGIEGRERRRTGISSLKVRFNRVFGYFIEVSRANLDLVPDDYERKQTLVNAERFVTPELKEYERKVLTAQERIQEIEYELFCKIRDSVIREADRLKIVADRIATLDALGALAQAAVASNYCRPTMTLQEETIIRSGRHPIVERLQTEERFVPNDVAMTRESGRILIVTGPNMGGKSTYLRQVASITLMAQAGSFVPADEATIGIADRIFSRIGTSDNLAGGQSTFMVEMQETANILNNATDRSLILLDEVGRGTSTFDGLSLAWAIVEHLHDTPGLRARVLFATHYHELTELSVTRSRIRNLRVSVKEDGQDVIFLRRIVEGAADRSYGIHVARLAGLPRRVIRRATEVLANLENEEFGRDGLPKIARHAQDPPARVPPAQLGLFDPGVDARVEAVVAEIRTLDLDRVTPMEALETLHRLRRRLDEQD